MRGRIIVIALAVTGVVIAAIVSLGGGGNGSSSGGGGTTSPKPPAGSLAGRFAYSPEKAALLQPLIREFNAQSVKGGGRAGVIQAVDKEGGGRLQPGGAGHGPPTQRLAL